MHGNLKLALSILGAFFRQEAGLQPVREIDVLTRSVSKDDKNPRSPTYFMPRRKSLFFVSVSGPSGPVWLGPSDGRADGSEPTGAGMSGRHPSC